MTASEKIDAYITKTGDWKGEVISNIRRLIHEVEPNILEEWKWNSPIWSYRGMVCSSGAFKNHVKLNFFQGAYLKDDHQLFNSGLDAKNTRSINYSKGDPLNESALKDLIRVAIACNEDKG